MCSEIKSENKGCELERGVNLRYCIKYCIDNFSSEEATNRIHQYIEDSLKLKEQEVELKSILK